MLHQLCLLMEAYWLCWFAAKVIMYSFFFQQNVERVRYSNVVLQRNDYSFTFVTHQRLLQRTNFVFFSLGRKKEHSFWQQKIICCGACVSDHFERSTVYRRKQKEYFFLHEIFKLLSWSSTTPQKTKSKASVFLSFSTLITHLLFGYSLLCST